jgi:hypothetical protein
MDDACLHHVTVVVGLSRQGVTHEAR